MTLALVKNSTFVKFVAPGGWFEADGLPPTSPAYAGWDQVAPFRLIPVSFAGPPPAGKRRVGAGDYVVAGGVCNEVYAIEDIPAPTISELLAHLADIRWQREVGGTVWTKDDVEYPVSTDRDNSQGKMTAEMLGLSLGIREDGDGWKFADGIFRPLTNAEMKEVALTARRHVAASFAAEGVVQAQIAGSLITTIEQVDAAFAAAVTAT